jgi:hypothetical protein
MNKKRFAKLHIGKLRRITAGLNDHEHPAVTPDGRLLAYYTGEYGSLQVVVCDIRGRLARRVSPGGGNNTQPAWHPNSVRVALRHQHDIDSKWEIWETDLVGESTTPRRLLADPHWDYKHPSYDPDGRNLAYFSDENSPGVFHIWLLNLFTGERKQLTYGNEQNHCHPVFSPDGTRIVYHAYEGTDLSAPPITNLYEITLATAEVRALTEGENQYKHPFYLDNDVVTYHYERAEDGLRRIEALHLPSKRIVPLTSGLNNDKHPFPFAINGKRYLAFSSRKLGEEIEGEPSTYDIFIARLRTGKIAQKVKIPKVRAKLVRKLKKQAKGSKKRKK